MKRLYTRLNDLRINQSGINMVDLMMWLVIAALLLAAAIQGIGFYQRAAFLSQLKSDLSGVGSRAMAAGSTSGALDTPTVKTAASEAKWSKDVTHTVEETTAGGKPFIRATIPSVPNSEGIYLFEACGGMSVGVNIVPKTGTTGMESCGIGASPSGSGGAVSFNNLTFKTASVPNGSWTATASSADGKKLYAGSYYGKFFRSTDSGATWTEGMGGATGRWLSAATSADGTKVALTMDHEPIKISTDSGVTWTASGSGAKIWSQIAVSSDGTKILASESDGKVFLSKDTGATWTEQTAIATSGAWRIAMSGDGQKMMAGNAGAGAPVYLTLDGGTTWKTVTYMGSPIVTAAEISSDGSTLLLKASFGFYKSVNNGSTWTSFSPYGSSDIAAVSVSSDGSKMAVSTYNSTDKYFLSTSTDGGATWKNRSPVGGEVYSFYNIASSSDGSKLLMGHSYTGTQLKIATYGP